MHADFLARLPELTRETREQRGLSYRQAADQIGVNTSVLHHVESGRDVRLSTVVLVARWLDEAAA